MENESGTLELVVKEMVEDDRPTCDRCGEPMDDGGHEVDGGDVVCASCLENHYTMCGDCERYYESGDMTVYNENPVCETCRNDNYQPCARCGDYEENDNVVNVSTRHGNQYWCEYCSENHAFTCSDCREVVDNGRSISTRRTASGNDICLSCYDDSYFTCASCSEVYHTNDLHSDDSGCYCEGCFPAADDDTLEVHQYTHKPHWDCVGAGPWYGVEVEFEAGPKRSEVCTDLHDLDDSETFFFLKDDGSLSSGAELVSHPMSLNLWQSDHANLGKRLSILASAKCKANRTTTCGLHVHRSRSTISDVLLIKTCAWIYHEQNQALIESIARRKPNTYCKKKDAKRLAGLNCSGDRYEMLNITGSKTIEFRMFRGTIKWETILASIEFCDALIEFLKKRLIREVYHGKPQEFIDFCIANRKQYPALYECLILRRVITDKATKKTSVDADNDSNQN